MRYINSLRKETLILNFTSNIISFLITVIDGSDAIRGLALENAKKYCPNGKKYWKVKCC